MHDLRPLDERLSGALRRYADPAVRPRDAMEIARAAHTGRGSRSADRPAGPLAGIALPRVSRMGSVAAACAILVIVAGLALAALVERPSTSPGGASGTICQEPGEPGAGFAYPDRFSGDASCPPPRRAARRWPGAGGRWHRRWRDGAGDGRDLDDPASGSFDPAGSMLNDRFNESLTLLSDGRVLVVGGRPYQPRRGSPAPRCSIHRQGGSAMRVRCRRGWTLPTATALADGRVLVLGGDVIEVWDPATSTFTQHGADTCPRGPDLDAARGRRVRSSEATRRTTPRTSTVPSCGTRATAGFTPAGSLALGRSGHTATLLPDGKVLVIGGVAGGPTDYFPAELAELWDPATLSFGTAGTLADAREGHTATLLARTGVCSSSAAWMPRTCRRRGGGLDQATGRFSVAGSLTPREFHTATALVDRCVLVSGGEGAQEHLRRIGQSVVRRGVGPDGQHRTTLTAVTCAPACPGGPKFNHEPTRPSSHRPNGREWQMQNRTLRAWNLGPRDGPCALGRHVQHARRLADLGRLRGPARPATDRLPRRDAPPQRRHRHDRWHGRAGSSGDGGPATLATFSTYAGTVAVDAAGAVYFPAGGEIRRIGIDGTISPFADRDDRHRPRGPAIGIAFDGKGDLLAMDWGANRIWSIDQTGKVTPIAGTGKRGVAVDGRPRLEADIGGTTWRSDRTVTCTSTAVPASRPSTRPAMIHFFAGTGMPGFSGDGGPATAAQLSDEVEGVVADARRRCLPG